MQREDVNESSLPKKVPANENKVGTMYMLVLPTLYPNISYYYPMNSTINNPKKSEVNVLTRVYSIIVSCPGLLAREDGARPARATACHASVLL